MGCQPVIIERTDGEDGGGSSFTTQYIRRHAAPRRPSAAWRASTWGGVSPTGGATSTAVCPAAAFKFSGSNLDEGSENAIFMSSFKVNYTHNSGYNIPSLRGSLLQD